MNRGLPRAGGGLSAAALAAKRAEWLGSATAGERREGWLRRHLVWAAVAAAYLVVFPYFRALNNPNENVRIWQTRAIAAYGTFSIVKVEAEWGPVGDRAVARGRLLSSKAPGTSMLGVPIHALHDRLTHLVRGQAPSQMASTWVLRVFTVALPLALFLLLFARRVESETGSPFARDLLTLGLGLGTMLYPYGLAFVGHAQAAALLFLGYLALVPGRAGRVRGDDLDRGERTGHAARERLAAVTAPRTPAPAATSPGAANAGAADARVVAKNDVAAQARKADVEAAAHEADAALAAALASGAEVTADPREGQSSPAAGYADAGAYVGAADEGPAAARAERVRTAAASVDRTAHAERERASFDRPVSSTEDESATLAPGGARGLRPWLAPGRLVLGGLLCGLAVCFEYQAVVAAALVAVYALATARTRVLWFALGALGPALALGAYHTYLFGAPLSLPYAHLDDPTFTLYHHTRGFLGLGRPQAAVLIAGFFTADYGLFVFSPFLAVGFAVSLVSAVRTGDRQHALIAAVTGAMAVFLSGMANWRGGWCAGGPRYIAVVVPFLVWSLALAWRPLFARRWWMAALLSGLVLASVALCGLCGLFPHFPLQFDNPIFDLMLPLVREGYAPHGLGSAWHLPGAFALAPLAALFALAIVATWLRAPHRLPTALGALVVAGLFLALLSRFPAGLRPEEQSTRDHIRSLWEPPRGPA